MRQYLATPSKEEPVGKTVPLENKLFVRYEPEGDDSIGSLHAHVVRLNWNDNTVSVSQGRNHLLDYHAPFMSVKHNLHLPKSLGGLINLGYPLNLRIAPEWAECSADELRRAVTSLGQHTHASLYIDGDALVASYSQESIILDTLSRNIFRVNYGTRYTRKTNTSHKWFKDALVLRNGWENLDISKPKATKRVKASLSLLELLRAAL